MGFADGNRTPFYRSVAIITQSGTQSQTENWPRSVASYGGNNRSSLVGLAPREVNSYALPNNLHSKKHDRRNLNTPRKRSPLMGL